MSLFEPVYYKNPKYNIEWKYLAKNHSPLIIPILEDNIKNLTAYKCWREISENPYAMGIIMNNPDNFYWKELSRNPNAIKYLEKNLEMIDWSELSLNPAAINIFEKNLDKVEWNKLSYNPNAIKILEKNLNKVNWNGLSENPNAVHLFKGNFSKIKFANLSKNPNAIAIIEHILKKKDFDFNSWNNSICYTNLYSNPNAVDIVLEYIENNISSNKIQYMDWEGILRNTNPKVIDKIYNISDKIPDRKLFYLASNPNAINVIEKELYRFERFNNYGSDDILNELATNPNAIHLLFSLNYRQMRYNNKRFNEELVRKVMEPMRMMRMADLYNMDFFEYSEYFN